MTKTTTPKGTAAGVILAARLKEARRERGMTQAQLAEWTTTLGHPVARATLAKIELGGQRAEKAEVAEVLALALALDVPPTFLLTPFTGQLLTLAGEFALSPEAAWAWFGGEQLINAKQAPLLPEHVRRRKAEDDLLAQAEEIKARRAQEGAQA